MKYTVGADGKPKDIVPNCTPEAYNELISAAIAKMEFKPALKGGAPTDWPGLSMPVKLSAPVKAESTEISLIATRSPLRHTGAGFFVAASNRRNPDRGIDG